MVASNDSKRPSKKKESPLVKIYLLAYNGLLTFGWTIILLRLTAFYILPNSDSKTLYENLKWPLVVFQNAAVLEIAHAATKIVPSNPVVTFQQVFSRVMLVCGVILPTLAGKTSVGLPMAVLAWSITEIIRYGYYTLNLINLVPHLLIWLRYTTFIVLYPIGVTGELLCLYAAQQEVGETGLFTIGLPNSLNFTLNYQYYLLMIMSFYLPFFPQLYMHMFTQRSKVLGEPAIKKD